MTHIPVKVSLPRCLSEIPFHSGSRGKQQPTKKKTTKQQPPPPKLHQWQLQSKAGKKLQAHQCNTCSLALSQKSELCLDATAGSSALLAQLSSMIQASQIQHQETSVLAPWVVLQLMLEELTKKAPYLTPFEVFLRLGQVYAHFMHLKPLSESDLISLS